jgi:metacaspase-1
MLILMDDGKHPAPTKKNITDAFSRIVQYSQSGDVVFVHYSGHGGRVRDTSGDEEDGYDETLIPVDFKQAGQILDDDLLRILVKPMAAGVNCTVLMDVRGV